MRIVVTHTNLEEIANKLNNLKGFQCISLDTETSGLSFNDRLFSIQLAIKGGNSYYLNFQDYKDGTEYFSKQILVKFNGLWRNSNIRWVIFNAKFDMRMLDYEGIQLNGQIFDPMIAAHIQYNKHMSYSLDNCLKRIGKDKNDEVSLYIKDNKLFTSVEVPGKKLKEKRLHFDKVPFSIMYKYGLDDVELTLELYEHQLRYFEQPENAEQWDLIDSNMQLVRAVWNMEREGIKINKDYCDKAELNCQEEIKKTIETIEELTQRKYVPGPKWLKEVLGDQHVELELSEKGNPILDKKKLKSMDNAIAFHILEMRDKEKEASFYSGIKRFADRDGIIHTSYRLTGTDTGRFSCSDPNLQQIPKDEDVIEGYTVRGAFEVDDDFILVSMDYDQMEYRIMADYAGEMGMIEAIKNGTDPHTHVANMMGVDRKTAKTLNFGLLYGMGIGKLAMALGKTNEEAKQLKNRYYQELPNVQRLTRQIMDTAVGRGYIKNKYGRRYFLDNTDFAYKMPNYLIQGTGADVVRHAIPKIDFLLEGMKSKLLLQVHDELVYKIHKSEIGIIPEIKRIMEDEYKPMNGMNLTCGCEFSPKTWKTTDFKNWSTYGN